MVRCELILCTETFRAARILELEVPSVILRRFLLLCRWRAKHSRKALTCAVGAAESQKTPPETRDLFSFRAEKGPALVNYCTVLSSAALCSCTIAYRSVSWVLPNTFWYAEHSGHQVQHEILSKITKKKWSVIDSHNAKWYITIIFYAAGDFWVSFIDVSFKFSRLGFKPKSHELARWS